MKKKTKEWIKENLIKYLNDNELTIVASNWSYKKGIGEKTSSFKSHYDDYVEEYLSSKFHLQSEEEETKKFFDYLLTLKKGNEEILLEFFKNKSPANKTKITKDGIVNFEYSSNEHSTYQKYMTTFLTDENMLFDYVGNLRFLGGEEEISFNLIKNVFSKEKQESLVEMYLNSSLLKKPEFERKLYNLMEEIGLKDKYIDYFPNLKEGKKDFHIDDFSNKQTNAFVITFDKETLVKQIEVDKTLDGVFNNIKNMVNLEKIKELNIESINIIDGSNKKSILILGDNLNTEYIKVSITEYMRITLKEDKDTDPINKFVYASSDFDKGDKTFNQQYIEAFELFKERIQKLYLKEKLDRKLVKEEVIKTKTVKI